MKKKRKMNWLWAWLISVTSIFFCVSGFVAVANKYWLGGTLMMLISFPHIFTCLGGSLYDL